MKISELIEKRAGLVKQARDIVDKAETEKRELSSEDNVQFNSIMDDHATISKKIETETRLQEIEREDATIMAAATDMTRKAMPGITEDEIAVRTMNTVNHFFRTGRVEGEGIEEFRALQADADTTGGFLVMPEQFVNQLIKNVDDETFLRQRATKFTVTKSESMGAPSLDTDMDDADWTSELATGSEDTALEFGKRELTPHPLAKRVKVSNKLLRISAVPAEQLIRERLAYKFGITQEKAHLTGNGSGQPLGIFTASAQGISTSRDVSTGNTATAIKIDGLIEAKYSLKAAYHNKAEWLFHRDAVKHLSKLKDGEGQYIWRESVSAGEPSRLLGMPFMMSEYAPNTFTTGLYVGMLGDYSQYWIVDALNLQVQRLNELYAETNQTGFIGRLESDGMPVKEEAFSRVKLG